MAFALDAGAAVLPLPLDFARGVLAALDDAAVIFDVQTM
jgi:hypothetical protein